MALRAAHENLDEATNPIAKKDRLRQEVLDKMNIVKLTSEQIAAILYCMAAFFYACRISFRFLDHMITGQLNEDEADLEPLPAQEEPVPAQEDEEMSEEEEGSEEEEEEEYHDALEEYARVIE